MNTFRQIPQNPNYMGQTLETDYFDIDVYIKNWCMKFYGSNKDRHADSVLLNNLTNFRNMMEKRKVDYNSYVHELVSLFRKSFDSRNDSNVIIIETVFELIGDGKGFMLDLAIKNFQKQLNIKGYTVTILNKEHVVKCPVDGKVFVNNLKIEIYLDKMTMAKL